MFDQADQYNGEYIPKGNENSKTYASGKAAKHVLSSREDHRPKFSVQV